MPRHPSFLLKIKIKILDIFYISLSLPLTGEEGVRTLASIKHSLTLSVPHSVSQSCVILSLFLPLSLSLTGEEGVHTLASIKHARSLSVPHSVSQSVSMCDYYINYGLTICGKLTDLKGSTLVF